MFNMVLGAAISPELAYLGQHYDSILEHPSRPGFVRIQVFRHHFDPIAPAVWRVMLSSGVT
jgi:hypothetical protein